METSTPTAKAEAPTPAPRLSPTVIALGVVSLLSDVCSEMVYTQTPIFVKEVLGAPGAVVGIIEGVAESTASLLRIVSGYFSDRSGKRKPLTLAGYTFGAAAKPLMALTYTWPAVLGLRFLDRLGKGLRTAPRDALIAENTPAAIRGRAFGLHRAMDTTGAVIGPLLGLWFLSHITGSLDHQLRSLFLFAGIPGVLSIFALYFFVHEKVKAPPNKDARPPLPKWRDLSPIYRRFLLVALLFNLGNSSDVFLILRARSLHITTTHILLLYAAFNMVEACFGYVMGKYSDRVGRKPLIIAGYLVFAVVYFGFGMASTAAPIYPLFILYGAYSTLTSGVQRAFAADLSDPKQRATHIGAYHTVTGVALLPASILAGYIFDRNPALTFYVGAATAVIAALLLAFWVGSVPRPVDEATA